MPIADSRNLFAFTHGLTYLNHGGYGVMPRPVMEEKARILAEIEEDPTAFFAGTHHRQWHAVRERIAQRFGLDQNGVAIVDNATDGINAVLRSLPLTPGDEILITSLTYDAVSKAAHHIATAHGAKIVRAALRFPEPDAEQCVAAITKALTPRTKIAILDHITSSTALLLPIAEMVAVCRERNVPVLVDGAHAPGQVALDIPTLNANWYVGNLHKWYFVPRGCGFLWAAADSRTRLFPNVLSWNIDQPFPANFKSTGTRDPSSWLCVPVAFEFMDRFGESAVLRHNHELIRNGVSLLADAWKSRTGIPDTMTANMALIPLPDGLPYPATEEGQQKFSADLKARHGIVALSSFIDGGKIWLRIAVQIYNGIGDFEKLAKAVLDMRGVS